MFFDYCYARVSAGFVHDQYQKFCLSSTVSVYMRIGGNSGFCCSMFTKSSNKTIIRIASYVNLADAWSPLSGNEKVRFVYTLLVGFLMKCAALGHRTLNKTIWTSLKHSSHMLHVLQFAILHGPGFSFSWKQFRITLFHLTTECIHLATVRTVVTKFLPKCWVHIHDQVASYEVLDNKHTLPNWISCTTFKAVIHTHTHTHPLKPPTGLSHCCHLPSVGNLKSSASCAPNCKYLMLKYWWESTVVLLKYAVYL